MARTAMTMSSGGRIAEHLSVGILARSYPRFEIRLPFQTDKLEITRFYESDNNSSSNTYVLTKHK